MDNKMSLNSQGLGSAGNVGELSKLLGVGRDLLEVWALCVWYVFACFYSLCRNGQNNSPYIQ